MKVCNSCDERPCACVVSEFQRDKKNADGSLVKIDLAINKMLYVVMDGKTLEQSLSDYGEVVITMVNGKATFIDTRFKRKV